MGRQARAHRRRAGWAEWGLAMGFVAAAGLLPLTHACDAPGPPTRETSLSGQPNSQVTNPCNQLPQMVCKGSPSECKSITNPNICNQQTGCSWAAAFCYTGPCGDYKDETSCEDHACRWAQTCSGDAQECFRTTQAMACNLRAGCAWSGNSCSGAPKFCGSLTSNPSACQAQSGCQFDSGCIASVDVRCSDLGDENSCKAGTRCAWQPAGCSGPSSTCEIVQDQNVCLQQVGCMWVEDT